MIEIQEDEGGWTISLPGYTVDRFVVCYELFLEATSSDSDISIMFSDSFAYILPSGPVTVTPGEFQTLPPVLAAHLQELSLLKIERSGRLKLMFANGNSIVAEPAEEYEAWQVTGTDGLMIVCTPGGEISIWHPKLVRRIK